MNNIIHCPLLSKNWQGYNQIWRTMKVTFVLLFSVLMHVSAAGLAQNINLNRKKSALPQIFTDLGKQSGYQFFYNERLLEKAKKVDVVIHNGTLAEALELCFKDQPFSYEIVDKTVVIKEKEKSFFDVFSSRSVDPVIVRGTVTFTQSDGRIEKVFGVNVTERGTGNVRQSGSDGEFTISVQKGATLVFTKIGFKPYEVRITENNPVLFIHLEENQTNLKETVITGYQQLDKKKFTGSSVKLKGDELRLTGSTDIGRALEGKVAGVSIQNVSGTFGSAPKIRIRGVTSLTGSNKPLWVVDGIALEDVIDVTNEQLSSGDATTLLGSSVAGINMNDVEDIYVLKDVAATSLYGARAMNGVVVVTTKKGKNGNLQINYTGNFSSQLRPSYNSFNISNSADQMSIYSEMYGKGMLNLKDIGNNSNVGIFGKMYSELQTIDPATGQFYLQNTPDARNAFLSRYASANTDWFHLLFRNTLTQEHSISISSGTDKAQHYTSLGYYNDNGWTIADKVKRYTFNSQNTYNFSDKLSGGIITSASFRDQQAPGTINRTADPVYGKFNREFDINPYSYALNTSRAITPYNDQGNLEYFTMNYAPFNIINELQNNQIKLTNLDVKVQLNLAYKINPYLKYEFLGAVRYAKTTQENLVNDNSNRANAYRANYNSVIAGRNTYLYKDSDNPNALPEVVMPAGGLYNRTDNSLGSYNLRNNLSYIRNFGQDDINILVGQEIRSADRQNAFNNGFGYQYDNGGIPLVNYKVIKQGVEQNRQYYGMDKTYDRFASFYATAGYTFNHKYNLSAATRYDGSNQLGQSPSARWLPTWSVGGSWNIDQEAFIKNIPSINTLKLRVSYGLSASTGNATNSALILRTQNTLRPYSSEIESGIYIKDLENSDLTYEKQYSGNIGVDAGFFNNRLYLSADIYNKRGFDLIGKLRSSGIGGQVVKMGNYANLQSHGVEFSISGEIIREKDWGLRSTVIFSYATNKITNNKDQPIIFDMLAPAGANQLGHPVSSLYSLDFQGLDHNTGVPLFINELGVVSQKINLQDIQTKYLKYEGPVDPPISGGFTNTLRYKAFSLTAQLIYQAGNKIRLNPFFKPTYSDLDAMPTEFRNRWILPGDETRTNIPSILDAINNYNQPSGNLPYNNYNLSSARVANGGFARLKYVSLAYQVPAKYVKALGLNSLSVSAAGTNLFLFFADKRLEGQDPEFFNAGGVAQPLQKQVIISLKVGI
ncbi:SusC/RagA family TonB-linked outer membrane protein [Pedobacter sp. PAMC26386]|nr:SusC/RagA family TonB-linked outer membrane protein [Pedobacter sp. PAMC26386]